MSSASREVLAVTVRRSVGAAIHTCAAGSRTACPTA
jgi:hypothetical protein